MKKIVYLDMDNVLVDFPSGIAQLDEQTLQEYAGRYDEVEEIFALMKPMEGALEAVDVLAKNTISMCFPLRLGIILRRGEINWSGFSVILVKMPLRHFISG